MNVNPVAKTIIEAIFSGAEKITLNGRVFERDRGIWNNKGLIGFRLPDPADPEANYLWIEQNPKTGSFYAKQAQAGAKVAWCIHSKHGYVALITDGVMFRKINSKWTAFAGI